MAIKNNYILVLCFALSILSSCTNNEEALKNAKKTVLSNTETNDDFKRALDKMMTHYFKLSSALTDENVEQIRKTAIPFKKYMDGIDINLLSNDQQLDWNLKFEMINFTLEQLTQVEDMNEIRTNFKDLSETVIESIKTFGLSSGTTYIFFCPEIMKDLGGDYEGAVWVSNSTSMDSPYSLKADCGSIVEQLTIE